MKHNQIIIDARGKIRKSWDHIINIQAVVNVLKRLEKYENKLLDKLKL